MTTSLDIFTQLHQDLHTTSETTSDDLSVPRERLFELIQLSLENYTLMLGHFNTQDSANKQRKQHTRLTENLLTCLAWSVACAHTVDDKSPWLSLQQRILQALIDHTREQLTHVQHPTPNTVAHISSDEVPHTTPGTSAQALLDSASTAKTTLVNARNKLQHFAQHGRILQTHSVQQTFILDLQTLIGTCLDGISHVLGPAPAAYALFSLGSLARAEACPFSDFEYALCLENDDKLSHNYGQAVSLLLEAQLILLGESGEFWLKHPLIIQTAQDMLYLNVPPALKLPRSNGFNLDYEGGNFPRVKPALIGSSSTLVGHLSHLQFNTNHTMEFGDFITLNALQEAHFFCGKKALFDDYWAQANQALNQLNPTTQLPRHHHMGWCYLKDSANEFIQKFNPNKDKLNIKTHFLRLPVFVANGLSLLFNLRAHSTQERLAALQEQGQLHPSLANALTLLLQIGFYWRIKIHLHYGRECDIMALAHEVNTEDNLDENNTNDFTLSAQEFNLFEPLYREIVMVLEQSTQIFITQMQLSKHCFQHTQVTDLSTVYKSLGAEYFQQGRWLLALAYYQQAWQLTQDETPRKQLNDWITNTKTLLKDHHTTVKAVLKVSGQPQTTQPFAAPPKTLWPAASDRDAPYPDGLHGLHAYTLAWLRLGVTHVLTLADKTAAWHALHTLRFGLPSHQAIYALHDELSLWQHKTAHQHRLQDILQWQHAWPQPKGFRDTLKTTWQDSWNTLEGMTEPYNPTEHQNALKKGRVLLHWIKPNPLNPAQIGNIKTTRLLKPELAQQLIDKHGHLLTKPLAAGQRLTYPLTLEGQTTPAFYAKVYPEFPGMQIAVDALCALLSGLCGNAILAQLYLPQKTGRLKKNRHFKPYPLLLSRSLGDTLQKNFEKKDAQQLAQLDTYSFTWKIIETLLIHPEDDKPDNIALQSFQTPTGKTAYRLVSFDADHAFAEAVIEKKHPMRLSQELLVQLKSILLCLDHMNQPLNPYAITEFLSLEPASVLEQWLNHCHQFNQQLFKPNPLFSPQAMKAFYEHSKSPAFLPIAFVEGMTADLYQRWHRLRLALTSQHFDSHHHLLAFMNPYLARFYHNAFTQHPTPDKRFHALPTDYKTIQDKGHDTLLYVTDTGVHQGTLRSLTLANQQKDIKKDLKTVIGQALRGEELLFQPKHALKELKTTLEHYQQFGQIQQEIIAGDFQRFAQLKIHTLKQKLFNDIVWTNYSEDQQKTLLKATQGTEFTKLKLINCAALTMNKLATLIKKSHNLVRLEIVNNTHVDNTLGDILAKHNPALQRLYLRGLPKLNQLLTAETNATTTPYTQLTTLVAEHCNIGDTGIAHIAKHLPYLTHLTRLDLRHNRLTDKAITALLDAINIHKREQTFQLLALAGNENTIKDAFLQTLIAALEGTTTELTLDKHLLFSYDKRKLSVFEEQKFQLFTHSLWLMPQLQILDLGFNWLTDTHIKTLTLHLKDCPSLQTLDLQFNHLEDAGIQTLAPHLKHCPNLKSLNFGNNNLSDAGIKTLATHLKDCPKLKSLNFGLNKLLGDTGIKTLAIHLKDCPNLKSLNLRGNNLSEAAVKTLAIHFKDYPNLQALDLGDNNLSEAAVKALAPHLKYCSNLRSLNLGFNKLGDADIKVLIPHIRDCLSLRQLYYDINKVSNKTRKEINIILGMNRQRAQIKVTTTQQAPATQLKPSTTPTIALPTIANPTTSLASPPKAEKQISGKLCPFSGYSH